MPLIDPTDPAVEHQQCAELVTQLLVLNRDLPTAAKTLGLKRSQARALTESETYRRLRDTMVARLTTYEEAWQDTALTRLRANIPLALSTLEDAAAGADKWGDRIKAADSILDRAGIERHSAAEIKHIVSLDQESVDRLTQAAREADAIDVTAATLADFSYARQRPITSHLRDEPPLGENPSGIPSEMQSQQLLPRQVGDRVRGPDPQPARRHGNLDSESEPEEARLSPT